MDLKNLNITVNELLKNPKAKRYLAGEFPSLINSPIIRLYKNITLNEVMGLVKGKISDDKLSRIVDDLKKM